MQSRPFLPAALAALACAPAALAQTEFGTGCPGFGGVTPSLTFATPAQEGSTFDIELEGAPSSASLLLASFNNVSYIGLPLPLDLGLIFPELPGCTLYCNPKVQIPINHNSSGEAQVTVGGWPAGLTAYLQVYNLDVDTVGLTQLGGFSPGYSATTVVPGGIANPGDVIFTEIMQNPSFTSDTSGEYFELYNTTAAGIDIEGWIFRDDFNDFHLFDTGGAGLIVPAGGYLVVGVELDPALNGNVPVDYAWNFGDIFLSNGTDALQLFDGAGTVIDRVAYDNGVTFPDPDGASMSLSVLSLDGTLNDDGLNWFEEDTCYLGGMPFNLDFGTPGLANDQCNTGQPPAASGELIFSELMQNPSAVSDTFGEWLEVYNTTGAAIDMDGYVLSVSQGSFAVVGPLVVPSGGYQVFARSADPAVNGGLVGAYEWSGGFLLSNGTSLVTLADAAGGTVAQIEYDNGATYPDPNGASMTLDPTKLTQAESADGLNWCEGATAYGDGDLGTPGAANDACPTMP